jgi:hypothetical protein
MIPVVILNFHFVPQSVGDTAWPPYSDSGRLLPSGEAELNPLLHHRQGDEVVLTVEAPIVQQQS